MTPSDLAAFRLGALVGAVATLAAMTRAALRMYGTRNTRSTAR